MRLVAQLTLIQNFRIVHVQFRKRLQIVTSGAAIGQPIGLEPPQAILHGMTRRALRHRRVRTELLPALRARRHANRELYFRRSERKFVHAGRRIDRRRVHARTGLYGLNRFSIQHEPCRSWTACHHGQRTRPQNGPIRWTQNRRLLRERQRRRREHKRPMCHLVSRILTMSRVMEAMSGVPASPISSASSVRRSSITRSTPSWPNAVSP